MDKTCATCAHGDGEGTIRFCLVKGGAAFNATEKCDWWTEPGTAICPLITATIEFEGLTFEMQPNESHLLEDTRDELALYPVGPGDVVVDVGAHVGMFALQAANKGATVYAVEPAPINLSLLRRNIERNGLGDRVHIIEKALSSKSGLSVPLRMGSPFPGQKSLAYRDTKRVDCTVETISLQELIEFVSNEVINESNYVQRMSAAIDFLKIDIEGEEFRIMDAGPEPYLVEVGYVSISLHDPTMQEYFDFGDGRTCEEYYADMVKWLKACGLPKARIDNHMAIGGHAA